MLFDKDYFLTIASNIKNKKEVSEETFKNFLQEASDKYYTSEESLLTDDEFDFFKREFITKFGYNPDIGTKQKLSKGFQKVRHTIPMGSLEEFSTPNVIQSIEKWAEKYSSEELVLLAVNIQGGLKKIRS